MRQINRLFCLASVFVFGLVSCNKKEADPEPCKYHSYQIVEEVPASCLENGVKKHYTCTQCHLLFDFNTVAVITANDLVIKPLGHTKDDGVVTKAPTHDKTGLKIYSCIRCHIKMDEEVLPVITEHIYDQHVEDTKFLKTPAVNCLEHNVYYTSCACGESSCGKGELESTFDGAIGPHSYHYHQATQSTKFVDGYDEYYSCDLCPKLFQKNGNEYNEIPKVPYHERNFTISSVYDGKEISLLPETARNYLAIDDDPTTKNNEIAEYVYQHMGSSYKTSLPLKFDWLNNGKITVPFSLKLATDENMDNVIYQVDDIFVFTKSLYNIVPGHYFYQLNDSKGNYSIRDSFTITDEWRAINSSTGIGNMRDMGGRVSSFGGRGKYCKIYRSAKWDDINTNGEKVLVNELKIKNEVDVRIGSTESAHPISGINFVNYGVTDNYWSMLTDSTTLTSINNLFVSMSNASFYPFTFHCTGGADRTGFVGLLVGGLMGYKDDDLYRDYELTSYFYSNRYRADVRIVQDTYQFDSSGDYVVGTWTASFGRICNNLLANYPTTEKTLSSSIYSFLITKVGLNQTTLDKVRNLLIEA